MNAPLYFASDEFSVISHVENGQLRIDIREREQALLEGLVFPLQGLYQKKNIPGVLQAVKLLNEKGLKISSQHVRCGLENVVAQTGLKGRWQILSTSPLIVCDTAHNLNGIRLVLQQIRAQSYQRLFFVFGMVKGKDILAALELLPKDAYYFFCQAKIPRALDAATLFEQASRCALKGEVVGDVNDAIQQAKNKATRMDMIFIGGSTYVVAEINDL
jgi:dihydrofolate synthase/folylpolyglutamate synthase